MRTSGTTSLNRFSSPMTICTACPAEMGSVRTRNAMLGTRSKSVKCRSLTVARPDVVVWERGRDMVPIESAGIVLVECLETEGTPDESRMFWILRLASSGATNSLLGSLSLNLSPATRIGSDPLKQWQFRFGIRPRELVISICSQCCCCICCSCCCWWLRVSRWVTTLFRRGSLQALSGMRRAFSARCRRHTMKMSRSTRSVAGSAE